VTLYEIKVAAATYFEKSIDDLTQHDVDLGLIALNHVRQVAELNNDFNFTRKLLQVNVDGVTGGSLDTAVEYGTTDTVVAVKTVVDVGTFDTDGNFRPAEWTTVGDSLNRERQDNPYYVQRYPTDAQAVCGPGGQRRFTFSGNKIYFFPKTPNLSITLGIEAYTFTPDWTRTDVLRDSVSVYDGPWTRRGSQYIQWATVIHLNHLFKGFVFRQEGNLPPPEKLAELGLASLQNWDAFAYEQFRRHSR
jgi:hypothetical protein